MVSPATAPPLPTLLSQALVAHTIELDNEAEHRLPHRTTRAGTSGGRGSPWLGSYVLWANALQYVGPDGLSVGDLRQRARTSRLLLGGLARWRYVTLTPPDGTELRTPPQDETVVQLTSGGRRAHDVWSALPRVIDERWRDRFGVRAVDRLEQALRSVHSALPIDPPDYLPVVYPSKDGTAETPPPRSPEAAPTASTSSGLSVFLSGVLLMFTLDFERASKVALATSANTLRVLDAAGVRVRDLPALTGVSKEGNAMCSGWLARHGCVITEAEPTTGRGQVLRLTTKGVSAQRRFIHLLEDTELSWRTTYGASAVDALREALGEIVGDGTLATSPLAAGLETYTDNWRARVRPAPTLPHYPMVLHRGGYPDGA
jgi:hypothetical protein